MLNGIEGYTIYHTAEWIQAIEETTHYRPVRLAVLQDSKPVMVLPLFIRKFAGLSAIFSPPPGLAIEYLGPIFCLPNSAKLDRKETIAFQAARMAVDLCVTRFQPSMFHFRCNPSIADVRPWTWIGFSSRPLYTYYVDLARGSEHLLESFKRELRYGLTRDWKGFEIDEVGPEALGEIMTMVRSRFRSQDLSFNAPSVYVEAVVRNLFPKHISLFMARMDRENLGGIVVSSFDNRVTAWVGARVGHRASLPVMDLLVWRSIRWALDHGAQRFDLMGANTPRLRGFMAKFNPSLQSYFELERSSFVGKVMAGGYRVLRGSGDRR